MYLLYPLFRYCKNVAPLNLIATFSSSTKILKQPFIKMLQLKINELLSVKLFKLNILKTFDIYSIFVGLIVESCSKDHK